jgi:hypothetical protein
MDAATSEKDQQKRAQDFGQTTRGKGAGIHRVRILVSVVVSGEVVSVVGYVLRGNRVHSI